MRETSKTESMEELRMLAEEQWEQVLSLEPCVRLVDGTKKSAIDLTIEEIYWRTYTPRDWHTFHVWRTRYLVAEAGIVHLGGHDFKHVDRLTPEDLPRLRATVAAGRAEYDAYAALHDFLTDNLPHLNDLGVEVDEAKPLEHKVAPANLVREPRPDQRNM
jgi:hypothetical protein